MRLRAADGVQAFVLLILFLWRPSPLLAQDQAPALSSAQSYTGIINMPNARVMPDWQMRLHFGDVEPYRYYGGALGLWDRLEFHGQFTEITSLDSPFGPSYGHDKDRSAGARLVLVKEDNFWPQLAVGVYDATGTALFGTRYLVASKRWGDVDFTFGLGQGILAGEYIPDTIRQVGGERGYSFIFSSLDRPTRPFGGLEWHVTPRLTLVAEASSIDLENMVGYRTKDQVPTVAREDNSEVPLDAGVKYQLNNLVSGQLFLMGGVNVAGGVSVDFPLGPEGILPWKKMSFPQPGEGERWQAYNADNKALATIIGQKINAEGFVEVEVASSETAVWIEAVNPVHLSSSRVLGHIFRTVDPLMPERIQVVYFNLKENGQVIQSLRTTRANLRAYLGSYQDTNGFLGFADLDLYGKDHWRQYTAGDQASPLYPVMDNKFSYSITPKVRTFLNNRNGFFKHKGVMRSRADYTLPTHTRISGEFEVPLFNQFDELDFRPLERDAVRTDLVRYDERSASRLNVLAVDHVVTLPYEVQGRLSAGLFESAFAGFGVECFRYFNDGLWGIGLEAESVRKRDIDDDFALRHDVDQWFTTSFVNLYAQLWPEQGLEGGIKVGRFLAGDPGVMIELRRSFRYCTIGAWYTKTDTDLFQSSENRSNVQKGVFVRIPFSIFSDHDAKGHFEYDFTSFTRDTGATVNQPNSLYPKDPWSTPRHLRNNLDEMRGM